MPIWVSEGILTDPAAGALLADTGPLPGGGIDGVLLLVWTTVNGDVNLQHRDATNTANVRQQVIGVTSPFQRVPLARWHFAPGERLRMTMRSAVVGSVQASLFGPW